ncbi:MAG: aminoacetone oxidase family FAD-binding enzyme [Prevotella sp.]|nr:aminoacetone oxidase family FAD-binding enzyme [Prevotella sp.]
MNIAIIGGGAAGCFAAINIKRNYPEARVTVIESGRKLLAKVAITGGGRCNLTNSFRDIRSIAAAYPRGEKLMKRLLREFSHDDTMAWFEREGVRLVTQDDQCVFPKSQDAMEIVGTLTSLMRRLGVEVRTSCRVVKIETSLSGYEVAIISGYEVATLTGCEVATLSGSNDLKTSKPYNLKTSEPVSPSGDYGGLQLIFDRVVVTTGGSPKLSGLDMLAPLNLDIVTPVPSLFSICLPNHPITELTGTVVEHASATLVGTKLRAEGPLLITHWGMSGPAILKLSSYAARQLHDSGYKAHISVNWLGDANEGEAMETIMELAIKNPAKQLASVYPQQFNSRLWTYLIKQSNLNPSQRWSELAKKSFNKLVNTLVNDQYLMDGKNRFKEEFVTCGGVALSNINPKTMECRNYPGLYFAGEVLDVDAITGGFNLQAAWSMAWVVSNNFRQNQQFENQ